MNGRTAKQLRRIAMGMAVASEAQGKKVDRVVYATDRLGTVRVAPDTLKGAYKALKRSVRRGGVEYTHRAGPRPRTLNGHPL